jgi:ATP-dependent DNA ligase
MIPKLDIAKFPKLSLPLPLPYPPMEALRAKALPDGEGWQFEPKWDGFRCLAFRDKEPVILQSKAGQPLTRYFPELTAALHDLAVPVFVLDGEIVVPVDGVPSFDDLLLRIHPAESRIAKLAKHIPAKLLAFDLLYQSLYNGQLLVSQPLTVRRKHLECFFRTVPAGSLVQLSPATTDRHVAAGWLQDLTALGLDGVIAKRLEKPYQAGERDAYGESKEFEDGRLYRGGCSVFIRA